MLSFKATHEIMGITTAKCGNASHIAAFLLRLSSNQVSLGTGTTIFLNFLPFPGPANQAGLPGID
jgi:hypothetical protein